MPAVLLADLLAAVVQRGAQDHQVLGVHWHEDKDWMTRIRNRLDLDGSLT